MPDVSKFTQRPVVGSTVVVSDIAFARPHLTTVAGVGVKDGAVILHHSGGAHWSRPEDVTLIPERMAGLMGAVVPLLREDHASVLTDDALGTLYLAVVASYRDSGDGSDDYQSLLAASRAEVERMASEADAAPSI